MYVNLFYFVAAQASTMNCLKGFPPQRIAKNFDAQGNNKKTK
jgi:hypothetical protein